MAITVGKLYRDGRYIYHMKLLAGEGGLSNLIQWVHIVEDRSVSNFLHGNELVFTAGIMNRYDEWLLEFTVKLHENGCGAFVINLGPHTKMVNKEVIDYCNQNNMPLFTIPWEVRMVDMTRVFCQSIIKNEQVELSIATLVKNIIFDVGEVEKQISTLERYGFGRDSLYTMIAFNMSCNTETIYQNYMNDMKVFMEREARRRKEYYVSFFYEGNHIMGFEDYEKEDLEEFIKKIYEFHQKLQSGRLYMGISPNMRTIYNLKQAFDKTLDALNMSIKHEMGIVHYENLGFFKILLNVTDKNILRDYYKEIFGALEQYDIEHGTEYVAFLRKYMEKNGSSNAVAKDLYIHRNTVSYQIKKVEKIIGMEVDKYDDRMQIMAALYIKNML